MVEASLLWVSVFRSSGRLTSSGSVKLSGADWGCTAAGAEVVGAAAVVGVVSVVGAAFAAWAAGFASLFEHADKTTAKTAAATKPRCVLMVSAPPMALSASQPARGRCTWGSVRNPVCKRQLTPNQALTLCLSKPKGPSPAPGRSLRLS